jgi:hypothetical protein
MSVRCPGFGPYRGLVVRDHADLTPEGGHEACRASTPGGPGIAR